MFARDSFRIISFALALFPSPSPRVLEFFRVRLPVCPFAQLFVVVVISHSSSPALDIFTPLG
jgi:hypothetical protein|tara:strand:- start:1923 stop:2108 length:186 start_codon:yes stop_codon:yes gene_type:complete